MLESTFARLSERESGTLSVAVGAVGSDEPALVLGELADPVAWSTAKVPVAIAAERTPQGRDLRPAMGRAIAVSDNQAADELWTALGDPVAAAAATDATLRDFGDTATRTESERVRPGFSAFGQTKWTLIDQARFAAELPCRPEAEPVYAVMGEIVPDQRWGLGRIPGARFKGGWGPSERGYLVRQFGVIQAPDGEVAVALAVDAPSLTDGTATLSRAAAWMQEHRSELPTGRC